MSWGWRSNTARKPAYSPLPGRIEGAARYLQSRYPNVFPASIVLHEHGGETKRQRWTWGDEKGLPDKGAGYYYVEGVGTVTNDELVELATKHGWNG